MAYSIKRRALVILNDESFEFPKTIQRVRTPLGVATVALEHASFGLYTGIDTGPEGYAIAVRAPKKLAIEFKVAGRSIDRVIVDGRKIKSASDVTPTRYRCRIAGGQHLFVVAWVPGE